MQGRQIADGIYVCDGPVIKVARQGIADLKQAAVAATRQRARLCAHPRNDDPLHEMLIVLNRATYVRPHRHRNKTESFHIVEGALTVVLFADTSHVRELIRMGPYDSNRQFYYRLAEPAFHTVIVESDQAVIHETTNGPFDPKDTDYADWSPPENDLQAVACFQANLLSLLRSRT